MKNFAPALLLLAFTYTSCSNSNQSTTNANTGGSELLYMNEWKLSELQGKALSANTKAMLALSPGQVNTVTGNTGCNRFNGRFTLSGDHQLKFSPLASTRMACLDETDNATERTFLEVLEKADSWSVTEKQLELKAGSMVVAKFSAQQALTETQKMLNGSWELTYVSGPKIAFEGLYPDKKPTLNLNLPDLNAGGNSSCNGYGTEIKLNGDSISFKDPIQTMIACEGNGEQTFFKALKMVTAFKLEDKNTLTLLAGNVVILRFTRKS